MNEEAWEMQGVSQPGTKSNGSTNKGAFGRAVRPLSEREFVTIMAAGFQISLLGKSNYRLRQQQLPPPLPDTIGDAPRPLITQLISRPFRDAPVRADGLMARAPRHARGPLRADL